jgi:hypothetical protein
MLKTNESKTDRMIRIVVGIILVSAGFFGFSGSIQTVFYVVGVIALLTGIVGFCGLYAILGINTCPVKNK